MSLDSNSALLYGRGQPCADDRAQDVGLQVAVARVISGKALGKNRAHDREPPAGSGVEAPGAPAKAVEMKHATAQGVVDDPPELR